MRLLLDTHTLIWLLNGDSALSHEALAAISDRSRKKLLSIASFWEIAIKVGSGKLMIGQPLAEFFSRIEQAGTIEPLMIVPAHLLRLAMLPRITATRLIVCSSPRRSARTARWSAATRNSTPTESHGSGRMKIAGCALPMPPQ